MTEKLTLAFDLKETALVNISLLSVDGKEVKSLVAESMTAGSFNQAFGVSELSTGIYLVRIQVGNAVSINKVIKQ
jgi:hypothetical protein